MKQIQANQLGVLPLGRHGENLARQVVFDLSAFAAEYGPGTAELIYQRPGDNQPYPIAVEREGNTILWRVNSADTAMANKYGRCELRYYVGDTLAKSKIWRTLVESALDTPSEEAPPEPQKGWVDRVLSASVNATQAAEKAEDAITKAPKIGENGNWYIWDATQGAYVDTGRYSGGSAPYIGANGNWFIGEADSGVPATGPAGPAGRDGVDGQPGRDGVDGAPGRDGVDGKDGLPGEKGDPFRYEDFTPEQLEALRGPAGHDGVPGKDGADGLPGKDGYTPQKGVDYFDGADGKDGKDGKTPVKGIDYFTPEEIEEIEQGAADKVDVTDKLTQPATASVGQIFRVQSVNEDGSLVLEAVDMPSGGAVDDVQVNGTSIVVDGIANIPKGSGSVLGVFKANAGGGIEVGGSGDLRVKSANQATIAKRSTSYQPIVPSTLDMAVKYAMCDGKGAAWNDAERLAALLRMGCTVGDDGVVRWAAQ